MAKDKISFDDYLKGNDVVKSDVRSNDVFVDSPKKFDFTVFFLCIITAVCVGITLLYYSHNRVPISDKIDIKYLSSESGDSISSNTQAEKININTADIETLGKLKGIGENKALAIVSYRAANGNFESIEQIKNVSGIGDTIFKDIKDKICV